LRWFHTQSIVHYHLKRLVFPLVLPAMLWLKAIRFKFVRQGRYVGGRRPPDCWSFLIIYIFKDLCASKLLWCLYNCCQWRQISACFFLSLLLLLPLSINNLSKPLQRTLRVWALKLVCPYFSPFHPSVSSFFSILWCSQDHNHLYANLAKTWLLLKNYERIIFSICIYIFGYPVEHV
jgi:hypothetical protein